MRAAMTTALPLPDRSQASPPPKGDAETGFTLTLDAREGYEQVADFQLDGVAPLVVDEPAPLGAGAGPNPSRLLGAALGSCLGASLMFCLRKARIDVQGLHTTVEGVLGRNERGRLRICTISVRLEPVIPLAEHDRLARCVEIFEDFCVVTASVRPGIDVQVEVVPTTP
jgi:organic hydroperoxide reductase OsmC/OhrA